jgi:hypothetical protein
MQSVHRLMSAAALALLSASAFATTTVYTDSASFLSQIAPGGYTESFNGLDNSHSASFSNGTFAYTLSSPGDIYFSGTYVSNSLPSEPLTITFTSGNVKAVGANFFITDFGDNFFSTAMTVTLDDGTTRTFTPGSESAGYRGFVSDSFITSLTISAAPESFYSSLDNLTVGTTVAVPAVPEPGTWALMGLGLAGIAFAARRKA